MSLQTEDTGKIFEMAICLAYGIPYDGHYKYGMATPEELKPRLLKLVELFPLCKHTARRGARYDVTSLNDQTMHLSAKSTKKGVGKVAPQIIGQASLKKFCNLVDTDYTTTPVLKQYIQDEILKIIPILVDYTFDCPNIFYNKHKNTIRYITVQIPIEWEKYQFKWSCGWSEWKNSSTLKIIIEGKEFALLEFQIHTKTRKNMAVRWCYETFLNIFKENLCIVNL